MEANIFFGKFIIGSVSRLYSDRSAERVCRDCKPFVDAGSAILDFGCGRGDITYALRKHFNAEVTGVDIQDARLIHDFPFYLTDGKRLPFKDKSFEVVLMRYVLHHSPDPVLLLREADRVSRKKIIIYEDLPEGFFSRIFCRLHGMSFNFLLQPKGKSFSFYDAPGWQRIFKELGLRTVYRKKFFSEAGPLYPIEKIFFVLENN